MKKYIFKSAILFFALLSLQSVKGQNPGDTIKVQAFQYSSGTRDTAISFPNSSLSFERVIMRYAMRCKDGLVSSGSQRNLGCGEWDYSCNTYIHNPNMADSVSRTIARYQITPNTNPNTSYSTIPTWSSRPNIQTQVILQSILNEDTAAIGFLNQIDSNLISASAKGGKSYVMYTAAELLSAGLIAGQIDAISLESGNSLLIKKLRIKLKQSAITNINAIDTSVFNGFQEVYFHDYNFQTGANRIQFNTPFTWDGLSNVILELNYTGLPTNNALQLKSSSDSLISLRTSNDISAVLFPSNYIESNSYQGISSNNDRTVEAWIKTSNNGEITSWGANSTGQKQSFYVNSAGKLRLEINGAFAIGTKIVNDGLWHHVAFTFSGVNMYQVKFYVDGVWDYSSQVSTKPMNTALSLPFQISKGFHNRYFDGEIDDVRVWSAALSDPVIKAWRYRNLDGLYPDYPTGHPNKSSLELAYTIETTSPQIIDQSVNQNDATFKLIPSFHEFSGEAHFKSFLAVSMRPNIHFYQGTYTLQLRADTLFDTTTNAAFSVVENTIFPKPGTVFTDSIGSTLTYYYPEHNVVYDLASNVVSSTSSGATQVLQNSSLPYYQRNPSKVEIMSFVTPYGINLDLGQAGKAWYFDLTDYLPILKGNRRITVERGGQWQENMDIQFLFIVGTPPAEVKRVQQIWKVDSRNYTDINNNVYFAPRTVLLDTSARRYKIRSAITGHGQQGEFLARNHTININNGAASYNNLVWKECAENPVYPQGGTWIYDRAGWCPGMPTDIEEYDISSLVNGSDSVLVDYNVSTASGDSRYIVNNQLVSYGNANFSTDARIIEVIRPNQNINRGKINPSCFNPIVTIQNTGSNPISSADIEFWINNGPRQVHTWTGSLAFMQSANVQLIPNTPIWSQAQNPKNVFRARILTVNGAADQYSRNDSIRSSFNKTDILPDPFVLVLKTNNVGSQNTIQVRNGSGQVVFQRNGMANNSVYADTISAGSGCFQLRLLDSGDDGLSFFANNSGTGYFRIVDPATGLVLKNFNPDFGDRVEYYYSVDMSTGLKKSQELNTIEVFPNPSHDMLSIKCNLEASWNMTNALGQKVLEGRLSGEQELYKIQVSSLDRGLYYLQIISESKTSTKKIIIN